MDQATRSPGSASAAPEAPLRELLQAFAAGKEVPGSGSANAVTAALAACVVASVAAKTHKSDDVKYVHIKQTAQDIERRARKIADELAALAEDDSAAFKPVIAFRRETGRAIDPYLQDQSRRGEIAALKPATEIPLRIARLALEIGNLAVTMLDSGFAPARGESYIGLLQALASIDGAIYIAQMNIRTVRQRVNKLNDPLLETDWIQQMLRDIADVRAEHKNLRVRQHLAGKALEDQTFTPTGRKPPKRSKF